MVSLSSSSSRDSLHSAVSNPAPNRSAPPSPSPSSSSESSGSLHEFGKFDDENVTITANRIGALSLNRQVEKSRSQEDIRLLAISTHITELSYSISDIQTRIFEIQELRHQSQATSSDASGATNVIDHSLNSLDERLKAVADGIKAVTDSVEPLLQSDKTPTQAHTESSSEEAAICRKHAALLADWESVQKESDMLREELREDKWLTVFRTVTEQADGMMASLEKAVNRCQEFIDQVQQRDDWMSRSSSSSSVRSDKSPINFEVFTSLSESFEAKKKHYMPATSKVLSILDKGVQDRVTKNGECLRRHAESTQRWKNLKARIGRTEAEMEYVRKLLLSSDLAPSEAGSSASGTTAASKRNGYLATPPSAGPSDRHGPLSGTISPFRKLARKLKGGGPKSPIGPPITPVMPGRISREPSSEPVRTLRHRSTIFGLRKEPPLPATVDRPTHKYSQSLEPDLSPSHRFAPDAGRTLKSRPDWNASTKVEPPDPSGTVRLSPARKPHVGPPPVQYKRSSSRSSMASSRPWSPITSSASTAPSSGPPPMPNFRTPSRPSSRATSTRPSSRMASMPALPPIPVTPRSRPRTPSNIPEPKHWRSMSQRSPGGMTDDRPFSPAFSVSAASGISSAYRPETPGGTLLPAPRPPSRSMIPIPTFQLQSASRPGSAMSNYGGRPDTSMSFSRSPDHRVRPRISDLPSGHHNTFADARATPRPSLMKSLPPSSFKDSASPRSPGVVSRPGSRAGAYTPALEGEPMYPYTPNPRDPLDTEVANVVNSIAHGFVVERVDPPMTKAPRENEEIKAQYAFSNALGRKVINCKLTTMARPTASGRTHKVMCRVGGGWQDLRVYVVNRQAAL
ncbi:hypothetical protein PUNSTDRAFT_54287 [Punctularia strigosozonata HHB-11173 SS5]|uniref:uncharacterized protein n=1 Tax=Punctularia strigosozonata (strain HHB-11173) TaxID=741275 RepID=UPI0004417670|nr:uncharacterized protein PUNSTDRAFT_54287 [Punctularia strigosozonata HHB-11173 SS5]EIN05975.1 hypothetical protein PUNSTDRAFT_54287 [Punctularia strigosozonata HHB-11173 SS5]